MSSLFESLAQVEARGGGAALCTIVRARGSVPRHEGSKMLVYVDGRTEGTIGGGELESRVVAAAREALACSSSAAGTSVAPSCTWASGWAFAWH
jgi:xanthine dehydrogenase accessory factor